jgi:hypothetical protein
VDRPAADIQRRRQNRVHAKLFEREYGACDIDDRVERTDLVQVDAIEGCAVDGRFGFSQAREETSGPILGGATEAR